MTVSVAGRAATLPHVLCDHANSAPAQIALKFLADGERVSDILDYAELVRRAVAIASELERRAARERPIVLLYPAGPDYLCALLACFWAGAIAVPAYPPTEQRLNRAAERIAALIADAGAAAALTHAALAQQLRARPEFAQLTFWATDSWAAPNEPSEPTLPIWTAPALDPEQPCLLQYTSGSTSAPKGVVITHAQLLANLEILAAAGGTQLRGTLATWLPPYHDMGLIGALLSPLQRRDTIVQMSPEAFVRRPVRWLRALSQHRAVATVTPNFALELCVRRVRQEQRAGLDLSALRVIANGAEPIDAASLDAFAEAYAPYGLAREALAPCYGMAEATLVLSANFEARVPCLRAFDAIALEHGVAKPARAGARSRRLVGCGPPQPADALRIVDPQHGVELGPGAIGEIWAASPSNARGYWRRPEATYRTFHAQLCGDDRSYLRTGDLGFILDGELFVTGRIKDQINIRGKKHAPFDIERTVQRLTPALIADGGAVFSIGHERSEGVCVVQEVDLRLSPDLPALLREVVRAVFEEHQVAVHAVALLKRGSLLRTSSGKVRRRAMKDAFASGELHCVARWDSDTRGAAPIGDEEATSAEIDPRQTQTRLVSPFRRARAIERFIADWVARRAQLQPETIDPDAPLAQYGVDSLRAAELAEALTAWLGSDVPSTISFDHPNLRALASALAESPPATAAVCAAAPRPTALDSTAPASVAARGSAGSASSIAIVGMACRFPAAPDLAAFWHLLRRGEDAVREVPAERWDSAALLDSSARPGKLTSRFGGFLEAIDQFDPEFFGITPHEAARMDPQHRLFLEVAWEALEDAGIPPSSLAGSETGVFAAVCGSDHALLHGSDLSRIDADFGTGNSAALVPNRLSYFLDLKGPSQSLDSACASALVALHTALHGLRSGECQLAIVGGVNAVLAPHAGVFLSNARALAGDGRCKTFDRRADGFVRSEGCGVIVLQACGRAQLQRRRCYALVSGSAVAHAGISNGLMAPNGPAQERVIARALAQADLHPDAIDYVEAHGVGAKLADTVELHALGNVLRSETRAAPCWVGSVKTNLGHLEAASGMASLIKTALALHHQEIPPNLHLSDPQPELANGSLAVPWEPVAWRRSRRPRHAGVSAFGFGGTLAHAILSEAPGPRALPSVAARPRRLLALSARSAPALAAQARRWAEALPELPLEDACYSANAGRDHFRQRSAFVAENARELSAALARFADMHETSSRATGPSIASSGPRAGESELGLLFTECVDAQCAGELHAVEPEFRRAWREAAGWLQPELGSALLPSAPRTLAAADPHEPQLRAAPPEGAFDLQPAAADGALAAARALAFQYALYQLFVSWGIAPSALFGRGRGEYLAAAAAGVLLWPDALALAFARSRLMAADSGTTRALCDRLAALQLCAAKLPLLLGARGKLLDLDAPLEAEYFAASLQCGAAVPARNMLRSLPANLCVEMGGREIPIRSDGLRAADAPLCIAGPGADYASVLEVVAQLYARGIDIDWEAFERPFAGRKLSLPTYPFQRRRCWLDPPRSEARVAPAPARAAHPLLRRMTREAPSEPSLQAPKKGTG